MNQIDWRFVLILCITLQTVASFGQDAARVKQPDSTAVDGLGALEAKGERDRSVANMKHILFALQKYHAEHLRFPPAVVYGKDGTGAVPHSWRVAILPYLEDGAALYRAYHFDEPWDSEANHKLLSQMPAVLRGPGVDPKSAVSGYYVVVGSSAEAKSDDADFATAFSSRNGMSSRQILDGTSSTIAIIEARQDVPWTKPEDILFDLKVGASAFGGFYSEGFHVGSCDGSVTLLPGNIGEALLRAYLTPAGREQAPPLQPAAPAAGGPAALKYELKRIKAVNAISLVIKKLSELGLAESVQIVANEMTNSIAAWGDSATLKMVGEQLNAIEAFDELPRP